jgi:hypothetical protein
MNKINKNYKFYSIFINVLCYVAALNGAFRNIIFEKLNEYIVHYIVRKQGASCKRNGRKAETLDFEKRYERCIFVNILKKFF